MSGLLSASKVKMRAVRPCHPKRFAAIRLAAVLAPLAAFVMFAGCATKPPASDPDALADYNEANDPAEPTNRVFYAINNGIDTVVLRPVAVAYRAVIPEYGRERVHNVLSNLGTPAQLADDMMQTNPRHAGDTLMRFLINTTVGVAGVFDVATDWGYPNHDTDFGITLALWGVGDAPFLFLPILGPSNPRDAAGFGVDIGLDPLTYVGQGIAVTALGAGRTALGAIDARAAHLDDIDKIKQTALDPYATFRSLARQSRQNQIESARGDRPATVPAWFPQPATAAPQ